MGRAFCVGSSNGSMSACSRHNVDVDSKSVPLHRAADKNTLLMPPAEAPLKMSTTTCESVSAFNKR